MILDVDRDTCLLVVLFALEECGGSFEILQRTTDACKKRVCVQSIRVVIQQIEREDVVIS